MDSVYLEPESAKLHFLFENLNLQNMVSTSHQKQNFAVSCQKQKVHPSNSKYLWSPSKTKLLSHQKQNFCTASQEHLQVSFGPEKLSLHPIVNKFENLNQPPILASMCGVNSALYTFVYFLQLNYSLQNNLILQGDLWRMIILARMFSFVQYYSLQCLSKRSSFS